MWWIVGIAVAVIILGLLEWRSWRKPAGSGFDDAHGRAHNIDRAATGGTDI